MNVKMRMVTVHKGVPISLGATSALVMMDSY